MHWNKLAVATCLLPLATLVAAGEAAAKCDETGVIISPTRLVCNPDERICLIVSPDVDSDGDGISDRDEEAAGTDVCDPFNTPDFSTLIETIARGELPSFASGRTLVFIPPSVTPDGKELTASAAFNDMASFFGARIPTRTLGSLGIDTGKLSDFGIDIGLGSVFSATGFGAGGIQIGGTSTPMFVGGVRTALIAGGSNLVDLAKGYSDFRTGSINSGKDFAGSVKISKERVQATFTDGSTDDYFMTENGYDAMQSTSNGGTYVQSNFTSKDGSFKSSKTQNTQTEKDGSTVEITHDLTTTTNADGSQKTTEVLTTTDKDANGKTTKIEVQTTTTQTDKSGNRTSSTTLTVTTIGADGETNTTTSACSDSTCKKTYINPDAAESSVVVLSAEELERAITVIVSGNTTPGPKDSDGVIADMSPKDADPNQNWSLIALYDPDGTFKFMLAEPDLWNVSNAGGTVRFGDRNGPEMDPEKITGPGGNSADRSTADAFVGVLTGIPD